MRVYQNDSPLALLHSRRMCGVRSIHDRTPRITTTTLATPNSASKVHPTALPDYHIMRKFIKSTREKAQGLRSPLRRSRSTSPNPTETSTGGTEAPRPSSTTPTSAGDDSSNLGSTSTIIASPPDRSSAPQIVVLQPLPTDHTLNSLALPSGNQNVIHLAHFIPKLK